MTKDLNILAAEVHVAAKAKGFWDAPRNTGETFMLIVSELGEALEAHRKGRFSKADFDKLETLPTDGFLEIFTLCIKDSFEDELADVVIRILDWMAHEEFKISLGNYSPLIIGNNVGEFLMTINHMIAIEWKEVENRVSRVGTEMSFGVILNDIFAFAAERNIDLWKHIELKLKYNASRPHKHGKAY